MSEKKEELTPLVIQNPQIIHNEASVDTIDLSDEDIAVDLHYISLENNDRLKSIMEINEMKKILATLEDCLKDNTLDEQLRNSLSELLIHHTNKINTLVKFEKGNIEREQEMYQEVNQMLQEENTSLKNAIEFPFSVDNLKQYNIQLIEKFKKWWQLAGFHYVSECSITGNGNISAKLSLSLSDVGRAYSETPYDDEILSIHKFQEFKKQGFDFIKDRNNRDKSLYDNDNNRQLLCEMITKQFPSAKIFKFESYMMREDNTLRYIEIVIRDLNDIQNLVFKE